MADASYFWQLVFAENSKEIYRNLATLTASTASVFRTVQFVVYGENIVAAGTSGAATVSAIGAATAGVVPVVAMAGVFVALGAGYYQARQDARRNNTLWGFAEGFVMGVSNWTWHQAWVRFGKKEVRPNAWDDGIAIAAFEGYNRGLVTGFHLGSALNDNAKKAYRVKLRSLAEYHGPRAWSQNPDEANLQQSAYAIELAAAGRKYKLFKEE